MCIDERLIKHWAKLFESGYDGLDDKKTTLNEVSGWDLEDGDITLVNSESDGDKLYLVKLWWGSGYLTDNYNAYAGSPDEALEYVVAYCEKNAPMSKWLAETDAAAERLKLEMVGDGEASSPEEAEGLPEFEETFTLVDATEVGASQPHYVYAENLGIAEYPENHNYPVAKGVRK